MTNFCKCYKIIFSHLPHFISNTSTITIFGVIKFSSKLLCARIHLYRHHPGGGGEARSEENNYLILTFSHHQHSSKCNFQTSMFTTTSVLTFSIKEFYFSQQFLHVLNILVIASHINITIGENFWNLLF